MEYHQPVLLKESIDGLNIKPNGVYVDVTFGGGGHSREILSRLGGGGKLIAFDQDLDVLENLPKDDRLIFVQHNFRFLKNFLKYHNIDKIDGLLADLGVSSHHFDAAHRGFSFRFNAPIDMRMNQQSDFSAEELLNNYSVDVLTRILREYGELKNARKLAFAIDSYRNESPIKNTNDLLKAVEGALPKYHENQFLAKLFQALRIEVNHEIDYLKELLEQAADVLNPEGRLSVISYHSLEDRVVKSFVKYGYFAKEPKSDLYGNIERILKPITKKPVLPNDEEIEQNSRARSAKLRIAEKV